MPKVALVTDSTATIPSELEQQYHISVAPQVLVWGDQTFEDGVDIKPAEFYTRLKKSKTLPSTSQATIASFHKIFTSVLDQGYEILTIVLSEKLSGTVASACRAQELFPKAPIEVVDSYTVAMALGFQVLEAARAAEQGASLAECKAIAEEARQHTGVIFAVDTLENLYRGGRIGGGTRFLGSALNIKPILEVVNGSVEAVERVRTRRKSLTRLVELMEERVGGRQPVRLAALHADAEAEACDLLNEAKARFNPVESLLTTVSPVVGNHAGPGTVGLAFMAGM